MLNVPRLVDIPVKMRGDRDLGGGIASPVEISR